MTQEQLNQLEARTDAYCMAARKVSFEIENRQEELSGILQAYQGMNDVSAQVLRQYFLNGGQAQ